MLQQTRKKATCYPPHALKPYMYTLGFIWHSLQYALEFRLAYPFFFFLTMRSISQKMAKIKVGNTIAVAKVVRFHFLPLKNLYMVADQ